MLGEGDMVRASGGRIMKICTIDNYVAECVWFDGRGVVHTRQYDVDHLNPFWMSGGPRTLWPEINEMPDEVAAAMDAAAKFRKSTKPRSSNKIKKGKS